MNPVEFDAGHALLAVLPIVLLIWLMVVKGWGAARAGPFALLLAIGLAFGPFGANLELVAFSQTKGALLSIWVLSIIWAALFLFHLVDETGQIPVIGAWLARLAPDRPLQVLLLAWVFTSFLQGIAGYGIPVAVVAPLMVGNGFTPLVAVVATSVGHSWSVTFGSLAASYLALAGVTGMGGRTLAIDAALLLGVACILCGAGAVWAFGGRRALASVAVPLLLAGLSMVGVQLALAAAGAYSLAAFGAGAVGLVVIAGWGRYRRLSRAATSEEQSPPSVGAVAFLRAFSAYAALIVIVLTVSFVAPIDRFLNGVRIELAFPETGTSLGWVNAATDSYRTLAPFGDTGSLLLYAALAGYVIYRLLGMLPAGSFLRAAKRTASSAVSSSIGIVTMVGMALAMTDSGMTFALAQGMKSLAGPLFPIVAPFIGVLGAFMTGSNTNSNILFGALQRDTAGLLGISTPVILAAQTTGGALGSMLAPAKIVVGCSTVGLGGEEGPVLRQGVRYGMIITSVVGLITLLWVSLS
ncbi:MAG: L-lactate permease [Acidimicrobiia bacterium]